MKSYNAKELFYIDCLVNDPEKIGNGVCDAFEPYYTEQCGYDGDDCPLPSLAEGYDNYNVGDPSAIYSGLCSDALPYNSEECNYDGGDCPFPLPVERYPKYFVSSRYHTQRREMVIVAIASRTIRTNADLTEPIVFLSTEQSSAQVGPLQIIAIVQVTVILHCVPAKRLSSAVFQAHHQLF